jgi:hypothetical protein
MAPNTGRLDHIIDELRRLHADADNILDAHVNCLLRDLPPGTSFGATKYRALEPAGRALNYVEALRLVRDSIACRRSAQPRTVGGPCG